MCVQWKAYEAWSAYGAEVPLAVPAEDASQVSAVLTPLSLVFCKVSAVWMSVSLVLCWVCAETLTQNLSQFEVLTPYSKQA